MEDQKISWGETFPMTIESDTGVTATLNVGDISDVVVSKTTPFTDGAADISIIAEDMKITPGEYSYQVVVDFGNGDIRKFPDPEACEDCSLPTITVCPTIDMPGGS